MSKLTEADREVIVALAGADMNICKASRILFLHRKTIDYHITVIQQRTGLNPRRFHDLVKLFNMVKGETQ